MATQVTLQYEVESVGASSVKLQGLIDANAVPVPPDILQASGLRVLSDVTAGISPVIRTIVIGFDPSAAAAVAAVIEEGSVASIIRLAPGLDYVLPPPVVFTGQGDNVLLQPSAQTFLELDGVTVENGGASYSPQSFAVVLGQMSPPTYVQQPYPGTLNNNVHSTGNIAPSCVQNLIIGVQGRGYTPTARILFDGPLDPSDPNARQAQAIITEFGPHGEIFAVQITDPGEGYVRVPNVTVQDDIAFGIEIVRKPDAISGAFVTAPNIIADNAATAILAPIMGVGVPAKVAITIVAGSVSEASVPAGNSGNLYIGQPQIVVVDPTGLGSGAVISPRMGLSPTIQIVTSGKGLSPTTQANLAESYFKALFPDTGDQRAPFWRLMEPAISNSAVSPVKSLAPVLA
jgi:hypothetical protein